MCISEIFLTENLLFHLQQLKFQEFCGKWKIPLTSVSFPKSMPLQRVGCLERAVSGFANGEGCGQILYKHEFVMDLKNG